MEINRNKHLMLVHKFSQVAKDQDTRDRMKAILASKPDAEIEMAFWRTVRDKVDEARLYADGCRNDLD